MYALWQSSTGKTANLSILMGGTSYAYIINTYSTVWALIFGVIFVGNAQTSNAKITPFPRKDLGIIFPCIYIV